MTLALTLASSLLTALPVSAQYQLKLQDFALGGNQVTDVWDTLTAAANPGTGNYPGQTMWSPVASQSGGGDAQLVKVANGSGGGPYFASASIYYGGMSSNINFQGGTLMVRDLTPVAGVRSVVFQVSIGEAWTYDFYDHVLPALTLTLGDGGTVELAVADYTAVLDKFYNGTMAMPSGDEPVYINTYALQWDLSAYVDIASFDISFEGVQHAQLYGLRLDQSDFLNSASVIPEPNACVLTAVGAGLTLVLVWWHRRRRRA